jgi:hypothetical protein
MVYSQNRQTPLKRIKLENSLVIWDSTTTADGAIGGTSLIDSSLIGLPDFISGQTVVQVYSGPNVYVKAVAASFNNTTGEITFYTPMLSRVTASTPYRLLNVATPDVLNILITQLNVPAPDSPANVLERDVIGNKTDAAVTTPSGTASQVAYLKGILNVVNSIVGGGTSWIPFGPDEIQVGDSVTQGVTLYDPVGGIIPAADITAGTYTIDRIRGGVQTNIVASTPSSKTDGAVYEHYGYPGASWNIGDLAVVTFSGIVIVVGGITTDLPPIQVWTRLVMEPDIETTVNYIAHPLLSVHAGTTTSDGAGGGTSLIDSALIGLNDYFTGKTVLITSGTCTNETERVSAFNPLTGEVTFSSAFTAQIVTSVKYEVMVSASSGGSGSDPWLTPLPGAYGPGTAGKIVGDNLDTTVSSRAAPGDQMALTAAEETAIQSKILSDATPFPGANIDTTISSRATPADVTAVDTEVESTSLSAGDGSVANNTRNGKLLRYVADNLGGGGGPTDWDAVYFDPNNGNTLVAGNDGTPVKPLSLEADVLTQIAAKKLSKVMIVASEGVGVPLFTLPGNVTGISFWGTSYGHPQLAINAKDAVSCDFHFLSITGIIGAASSAEFYNCQINVSDLPGCYYEDCSVITNAPSGALALPVFKNCVFNGTIDSAPGVTIYNGCGVILLTNNAAVSIIIGNGMDLTIDASCAVSSITVYGGVKITNNGTSTLNDYTNKPKAEVSVNTTAVLASETDIINLATSGFHYTVDKLRLKSDDPGGGNSVLVRLYELVNAVSTEVDNFTIDSANYTSFFSLMDMFGLQYLAGDNLRVSVEQLVAGGPTAITGSYTYRSA